MSDLDPCAACGACCRSYLVPVCGYDVWLISTRQHLSPEQYLVSCPYDESKSALDRFYLAAGDKTCYTLVLDKQSAGFHIDADCIFLLHLADGTTRCGIYGERPVCCRTYPMGIWQRRIFQRKNTLCPPGAWPEALVQRPGWRDALQTFHFHLDLYHEVVARWNARVTATPAARYSLADYFTYLLNVYDRLAALDAAVGPEELARVQAAWPTVPRPTINVLDMRISIGEVPWLDYFSRARQVIDSFLPDLPPQPLQILTPMTWADTVGQQADDAPAEAMTLGVAGGG